MNVKKIKLSVSINSFVINEDSHPSLNIIILIIIILAFTVTGHLPQT